MDSAGFSAAGFSGNIWFFLILRIVQATRNQLCPCGAEGSNPSLPAKPNPACVFVSLLGKCLCRESCVGVTRDINHKLSWPLGFLIRG
jgi:hypothetical protein